MNETMQRPHENNRRVKEYEERLKDYGLLNCEDRRRRERIGRRIQSRLARLRSNPKLWETVL